MTPDDFPPAAGALTRRELRQRTTPSATAVPAAWADDARSPSALVWVDPALVEQRSGPASLDTVESESPTPPLLAGARRRPALVRAGLAVPLATLVALSTAYAATMLLWPLHELPPTLRAVPVETVAAAPAVLSWPAQGSAAVGVDRIAAAASTADSASIASITKVVSCLMVLDRMPLQLGESGPGYRFTSRDNVAYWDYRRADQSALDVPVGGELTQYQLLQGTLMASANNYIDRLAREIWGSDAQFADAAETWLAERGLNGIRVVNPSGFDEGNTATPEALLRLAERALQNPVIAEIVGTVSTEIPGAGTVTNTNGLLADPGVLGVKTGTLVGWSLLSAKDITVGAQTVRVYAAVLNQDDDAQRLDATRRLFAEVEEAMNSLPPTVARGTVVGTVHTPWGETVDAVTAADATVLLWNAASASPDVRFTLGEERAAAAAIGSLTVTGPGDASTVDVTLAKDIPGPTPWWRLTHPLDLLGLNGDPSPR